MRRRRGARAGWRASLIVAPALLPLAVAAAAGIQAASIVWTPALVIVGCAASVLAYTTLRHVDAGGPRPLCSWGEVERGLARELRRARRRRVLRGRSACLPGEMPPSSPFPTPNSRRQ
jgi:hypothetical protein